MNYQVHIENLGAVKKADFTLTPLTIFAGKNGTGKSFVSKFLYSVFKVLSEDVQSDATIELAPKIIDTITEMKKLSVFSDFVSDIDCFNPLLEQMEKVPDQNTNQKLTSKDKTELLDFLEHHDFFLQYCLEIENKIKNIKSAVNDSLSANSNLWSIVNQLLAVASVASSEKMSVEKVNEALDLISLSEELSKNLDQFHEYLQDNYNDILITGKINNELKDNFQIQQLFSLVRFDEKQSAFKIDNLLEGSINEKNMHIKSFTNTQEPRPIFIESPVYWKMLSTLAKHQGDDEVLTGIPKYFYDLKDLLFTKFKNPNELDFIEECADDLQQSLQGKFEQTAGDDLAFKTESGKSIDKSLISFGMTNLGILQAILKQPIVKVGSFVFIDEPETNLHPAWQNILADTLVKLADNGIFVIVTTHSAEMLRALNISSQEQKIGDKLSAYYFETNGELLQMDNPNLRDIEQAQQQLLAPYDDLTVRSYRL